MDQDTLRQEITTVHADLMKRVTAIDPKAAIVIAVISGGDSVVAHNYATQAGLKAGISTVLGGMKE